MSKATVYAIDLTERGLVPDVVVRKSIRELNKSRLNELSLDNCEAAMQKQTDFIAMMDNSPIALMTDKANEQHYEVPADFFSLALGKQRKYSSCYWDPLTRSLDQAEKNSLLLSCEHAEFADGMDILELGCGWGSLTLWMAEHYPNANITAVSNSHSQKTFIESQAQAKGLNNIRIVTADMNDFHIEQQFDRVVSIEMFEHMRNYRELMRRISNWLKADGKFFMHIFCHRTTPYEFADRNDNDWMSRHFFSGGIMPSQDLPLHFQDHLKIDEQWRWSGTHYEKTANAWLENTDQQKEAVLDIFANTYGADDAHRWWMRWRMFFMACAELFGHDNGQEWYVSHYRFAKKG